MSSYNGLIILFTRQEKVTSVNHLWTELTIFMEGRFISTLVAFLGLIFLVEHYSYLPKNTIPCVAKHVGILRLIISNLYIIRKYEPIDGHIL